MKLVRRRSMNFRKLVASALCFTSAGLPCWSQQAGIAPERPSVNIFVRPYQAELIPPIRTSNSARLRDLVRAGKLYLTAQDAIALALENNIDIEVARYSEPLLEWRLVRAEAGGALPGVPSAQSQASGVTSGQGVLGSQQAVGLTGGNNGITRNTTNATITQIGPVTQNLDAIVQESSAFAHRSLPQANATQSV